MSPSTRPTNAHPVDCGDDSGPLWFDAHNHLHDARLGGDFSALIATQREAGVRACVVNATCEADWPVVTGLHERFPDFIRPALGIHPWCAHTAVPGWQERLIALLEKHPAAVIGECGLDSWIENPPLSVQIPVFVDQLRISNETGRAMTIHCLKAWGALFEVLGNHGPGPCMLFHSFGGSLESARRLLSMGAFFSFSGYFLHERKQAVRDVFRQLPADRILLETDAPDMNPPEACRTHGLPTGVNHPANLAAIGRAWAGDLGIAPEELAQRTATNARRWLGS